MRQYSLTLAWLRRLSLILFFTMGPMLAYLWQQHTLVLRWWNIAGITFMLLVMADALFVWFWLKRLGMRDRKARRRFVFVYGATWAFLGGLVRLKDELPQLASRKNTRKALQEGDIEMLYALIGEHQEREREREAFAEVKKQKRDEEQQLLAALVEQARSYGIPEHLISDSSRANVASLQKLVDSRKRIEPLRVRAQEMGLDGLLDNFFDAGAAERALDTAKALRSRVPDASRVDVDRYLRMGNLIGAENVVSRSLEVERLRTRAAILLEPKRQTLFAKLEQLAGLTFESRDYRKLRYEVEQALSV